MYSVQNIEFYSTIVQNYYNEWKDNQLLMPLFQQLMARIPERPNILDLGCGPGIESKKLSDLGANVIGIDLSEESLRIARQHAPFVKFIKMDALEIDFADSSFDAILDSAVLIHFSDKEQCKIVEKINKLLNDKGLFLSIYLTGDLNGLQKREVDGKILTRYVNLKSIDKWIKLVCSMGFNNAEKLDLEYLKFRAVLFIK